METVTIDLCKYHEMKTAYEEFMKMKSKQEFEKVMIKATLHISNMHSPYFGSTIYTSNPNVEIQEATAKVKKGMDDLIKKYNKELTEKHKTREDVDRLEKEIKKTWKKLFIYNIITLLIGIAIGLIGII